MRLPGCRQRALDRIGQSLAAEDPGLGMRFAFFTMLTRHEAMPEVDFVAHARALGAESVRVKSIADLETAFKKARAGKSTQVIVIETDPMGSTDAGGFWWDVAVPAVSERKEVDAARRGYEEAKALQRVGD